MWYMHACEKANSLESIERVAKLLRSVVSLTAIYTYGLTDCTQIVVEVMHIGKNSHKTDHKNQ